jgi:hypothetical protein
VSSLVQWINRDRRRTRCPECGRDLVATASGKRLCAYAEYHKSGLPIIEADRHTKGEA